jgi:hypothetical protein
VPLHVAEHEVILHGACDRCASDEPSSAA